ncbi:hypothetical protein [Stenotrophomonas sp. 24(2023)]|uniref:hypothetical protein n=1 Tax=Stenotrophomonas sp. 24(2023) TaxID=3068324 RepID=UPI0027DEE337|nr:hypothetical protein [Stenotrophomonas sp. 24(2023)]WMJ69599.1 hypothetical protein Q9R17_00380 [Stenotrophomonas sp. 24(2023)]
MTDTDQILGRLQACEAALDAQRGYIKALEYGLRVLVVTHPAPGRLGTAWKHLLPGIADTHVAADSALFTAAFQQALAGLSEQIALAASSRETG